LTFATDFTDCGSGGATVVGVVSVVGVSVGVPVGAAVADVLAVAAEA
jgi:hypothetical protein